MRRAPLAAVAAAVAVVCAALPGEASQQDAAFGPPVKVTPDLGYGFEPAVYTDRFGNVFVTAHKENIIQIAAAPDPQSATLSRSMSWAWYSADGGKTFQDLPTGPADLYNHQQAHEGDFALDDAGNLYFADLNTAFDITFHSWQVTGRGKIEHSGYTPTLGTLQYSDDRPWLAAHGNGKVFLFANAGGKNEYLGNHGGAYGTGTGAGRYTVYRSPDGGKTWDTTGTTLLDSGWCRPAAAPQSTYVHALCGNDEGVLYSYVSADDGASWQRYRVGTYHPMPQGTGWWTYPTVSVLADGSMWGLFPDPYDVQADGTASHVRFRLYHSIDRGRTWTVKDVTDPTKARYQYMYGWLSVSDDGKTLGYATYARPDRQAPWKVYATTFRPAQQPTLVSIDDEHPVTVPGYWAPPADFLSTAFDREGRLNVVWTRASVQQGRVVEQSSFEPTIAQDIFFATSR